VFLLKTKVHLLPIPVRKKAKRRRRRSQVKNRVKHKTFSESIPKAKPWMMKETLSNIILKLLKKRKKAYKKHCLKNLA
jgi:hypothetical protein